jgi:3',5'-cyclic AMP phosphodiesterase CpdA
MQTVRKWFLMLLVVASLVYGIPAAAQSPAHSEKPVYQPEDTFQFVIVSDLWGGNRPGVFDTAVQHIKDLQPSFVISVGDLIDGVGQDGSSVKSEWDHFDALIEPLGSRFYYVPGNHDIAKPVLRESYGPNVGDPYYSFDFGGCHFVVMNSSDGPNLKPGFGEDQLKFVRDDLARNKNAAHTFLFVHHPLFQPAKRGAAASKTESPWAEVMKTLGDRPHTVFAGHTHRYAHSEHAGNDYYVLATTGAGGGDQDTAIRFDCITLVTVRKGNPSVKTVKLSGFVPKDVPEE